MASKLRERLLGALRSSVGAARGRRKPALVIRCDSIDDALPYAYWTEKRPVRLMLPVECLRMQGAFRYDAAHPFLAALRDGSEALANFYNEFTPGSVSGMYGLPQTGRTGEDLPQWELPWLMRQERRPPPGERGLGPEHGVSFYGPATEQKVEFEYERLKRVTALIEQNGFVHERYRDIEGHLMTNGEQSCFFVRGGKHRTAAMVHLGHAHIPVQLRRWWPLIVDSRSAEGWPLVANGAMDRSLATDILDTYVRGRSGRE